VITEVVDEHNRAVPPGVYGARVLVSVLFSRTQPLIRYEMSDTPRLATEGCECGLPFALLGDIEGRREDTLILPKRGGGTVDVHPIVFHRALEHVPASGWQVVQERAGLHVLVADTPADFDVSVLGAAVTRELAAQGVAALPVTVERAPVVRTALGKAPLVRALPHDHGGAL
jgi:phenylacetate-coenzyme A ligase PaaK-like adenylate-forming protein